VKALTASYRGGFPINYQHLKGLTSVCPNKICCFLPFFRIIVYPANFNLVMFIFKLFSYCSEQFLVSVFSESIIYNRFSIKLLFQFRARLVSAQPEMENNGLRHSRSVTVMHCTQCFAVTFWLAAVMRMYLPCAPFLFSARSYFFGGCSFLPGMANTFHFSIIWNFF
jgi:hypothetical protein